MKLDPSKAGRLHFIGIGGVGMSGIAEVLHNLGYLVQGSDSQDNSLTQRLRQNGVPIFVGHDAQHLEKDVRAVVVSSAIPQTNEELQEAKAKGIPVIRRADMLAELMRIKFSVAVAGTHGKTTTTSLIGTLLEAAGLDPTVVNGGIVNAYGSNARSGKGNWIVAEADESDGTFTRLPVTLGIITNIDPEHMEFYHTQRKLEEAFLTFLDNLPFYGLGILCIDHPRVQRILPLVEDKRLVTYGLAPGAQIRATNVRITPEGTFFDVTFTLKPDASPTIWEGVHLNLYGTHNVQNALAALAVAQELEIPENVVRQALATFAGVSRRFTQVGCVNSVPIIDDYAHHPVEITAVLQTARQLCKGKLIAVCQPHRYTRLAHLFEAFQQALRLADAVVVLPIYTAGESPLPGVSSEALAQAMAKHGKPVVALEDAAALAPTLAPWINPNDMVICMGAGNMTTIARALPQQLGDLLPDAPHQQTA